MAVAFPCLLGLQSSTLLRPGRLHHTSLKQTGLPPSARLPPINDATSQYKPLSHSSVELLQSPPSTGDVPFGGNRANEEGNVAQEFFRSLSESITNNYWNDLEVLEDTSGTLDVSSKLSVVGIVSPMSGTEVQRDIQLQNGSASRHFVLPTEETARPKAVTGECHGVRVAPDAFFNHQKTAASSYSSMLPGYFSAMPRSFPSSILSLEAAMIATVLATPYWLAGSTFPSPFPALLDFETSTKWVDHHLQSLQNWPVYVRSCESQEVTQTKAMASSSSLSLSASPCCPVSDFPCLSVPLLRTPNEGPAYTEVGIGQLSSSRTGIVKEESFDRSSVINQQSLTDLSRNAEVTSQSASRMKRKRETHIGRGEDSNKRTGRCCSTEGAVSSSGKNTHNLVHTETQTVLTAGESSITAAHPCDLMALGFTPMTSVETSESLKKMPQSRAIQSQMTERHTLPSDTASQHVGDRIGLVTSEGEVVFSLNDSAENKKIVSITGSFFAGRSSSVTPGWGTFAAGSPNHSDTESPGTAGSVLKTVSSILRSPDAEEKHPALTGLLHGLPSPTFADAYAWDEHGITKKPKYYPPSPISTAASPHLCFSSPNSPDSPDFEVEGEAYTAVFCSPQSHCEPMSNNTWSPSFLNISPQSPYAWKSDEHLNTLVRSTTEDEMCGADNGRCWETSCLSGEYSLPHADSVSAYLWGPDVLLTDQKVFLGAEEPTPTRKQKQKEAAEKRIGALSKAGMNKSASPLVSSPVLSPFVSYLAIREIVGPMYLNEYSSENTEAGHIVKFGSSCNETTSAGSESVVEVFESTCFDVRDQEDFTVFSSQFVDTGGSTKELHVEEIDKIHGIIPHSIWPLETVNNDKLLEDAQNVDRWRALWDAVTGWSLCGRTRIPPYGDRHGNDPIESPAFKLLCTSTPEQPNFERQEDEIFESCQSMEVTANLQITSNSLLQDVAIA